MYIIKKIVSFVFALACVALLVVLVHALQSNEAQAVAFKSDEALSLAIDVDHYLRLSITTAIALVIMSFTYATFCTDD